MREEDWEVLAQADADPILPLILDDPHRSVALTSCHLWGCAVSSCGRSRSDVRAVVCRLPDIARPVHDVGISQCSSMHRSVPIPTVRVIPSARQLPGVSTLLYPAFSSSSTKLHIRELRLSRYYYIP